MGGDMSNAILTEDEVSNRLSNLPVFFIGGLPRSGTTWVQQLLNHHPNLVCLGESHFVNDLVPNIATVTNQYRQKRSQNFRTWAPSVKAPEGSLILPILRAAFISIIQANIGDKNVSELLAIGEKTPDNILHLKRILSIYPNVYFIHVIRDGRDSAISAYTRFKSKLPKDKIRSEYIKDFAKEWSSRISISREIMRDSQRYIEVRYEDMHESPETEVNRMLSFLQVDNSEDCISKCINASTFESLSGGRKRGEVDNNSHYRRGEIGGWKDSLTENEVRDFEMIAAETMRALGYNRYYKD